MIKRGVLLILIALCLICSSINYSRLYVHAEDNMESEEIKTDAVHLRVDNKHKYKGMNGTFSKGYLPVVKKGKAEIIVPFMADGNLKKNSLTVSVELGDGENTPFVLKKYEKTIKKQKYSFGKKEVEAYVFHGKIDLLKDAPSGQYPVVLHAFGYDDEGNEATISCTVYVKVEPSEEGRKVEENEVQDVTPELNIMENENNLNDNLEGKEEEILHGPKFLIASNNLGGTNISAGGNEKLEVEFINKSNKYGVYNLKASITCDDENLMVSSSGCYESFLSPGGNFKILDEIMVSPSIEQGIKVLTFQLEYEDKKGTAYTDVSELRFMVTQPIKAELKSFQLPETVTATETVVVELQMANEGRSPIYNVSLSLDGEGLKPTGETFLGNIEAGTAMDETMKLYISGLEDGTSYGNTSGVITLQYEDGFGNSFEEKYDCKTTILEPQIVTLQLEEEKEETNQWWISIAIVVILILVSINVGCILRIKKMRKEEISFEP